MNKNLKIILYVMIPIMTLGMGFMANNKSTKIMGVK